MARKKKVGILTGGGDVAGLNAAIKAAVHRAADEGWEVTGIRRGWGGLLSLNPDDPQSIEDNTLPLTRQAVRTIDRTGGTFLHTSRLNPQRLEAAAVPDFVADKGKPIKGEGEGAIYDLTPHVLRVLSFLKLDALLVIGGDDTLSSAARLHNEGVSVVAIPKTMDNDVYGTDYCIGFSTAVTRSVNMIDDLRTTCGSHERIAVVELFGRNSGETSLITAYLADVDRAIISEVPFDIEKLAAFLLRDKRDNPSNYCIMTISEGAREVGSAPGQAGETNAFGRKKPSGIGRLTSDKLQEITREEILFQQLSYLMRSGEPDSLDRMVAISFGQLAMSLVLEHRFGRMAALRGGNYTHVPLNRVIAGVKQVDVDEMYDAEQYRPKIADMHGKPMFLY